MNIVEKTIFLHMNVGPVKSATAKFLVYHKDGEPERILEKRARIQGRDAGRIVAIERSAETDNNRRIITVELTQEFAVYLINVRGMSPESTQVDWGFREARFSFPTIWV